MKSVVKKLVKKKKPQIRVSYPTGHHTIEDLQILEFEENQSFLKRSFFNYLLALYKNREN